MLSRATETVSAMERATGRDAAIIQEAELEEMGDTHHLNQHYKKIYCVLFIQHIVHYLPGAGLSGPGTAIKSIIHNHLGEYLKCKQASYKPTAPEKAAC